MMAKKLLLVGGGGHCRSIIDCVMSSNVYEEIGIVDYDNSASALGVPVIGTDDDLPQLKTEGWTDAFVSVGSVGSTTLRRALYQKVKTFGFSIPTITDPSAAIARGVSLREGVFVGKNATVNTGSDLGICSIINTGAIIEHDCEIGSFTHISPGAVLCGQVTIGHDSHLGAGSVVKQGIRIGNDTMIGIGSVVVDNVADHVKAYGNPCRVIE